MQELQTQKTRELPVNVPMVNDYAYIDPRTQQKVEMPLAEQFGQNFPQYYEAMRNFEIGKKNAFSYWQQQQTQQLEQQRIDANFIQNLKEVKQKNLYKDFDQVVTRDKLDLIDHYNLELSEAIKASPYASHLLYGICKSPELREEFLKLSPRQALVELGKMEAEMELAMKPNVVTKAPPPIQNKPSSGARKAQSFPKDASNMSQREFNARIKEKMLRGK